MSMASCCLRGTASVVARTSGSRSLDFALGTRRTSHAHQYPLGDLSQSTTSTGSDRGGFYGSGDGAVRTGTRTDGHRPVDVPVI
jgi:hypothetical protein